MSLTAPDCSLRFDPWQIRNRRVLTAHPRHGRPQWTSHTQDNSAAGGRSTGMQREADSGLALYATKLETPHLQNHGQPRPLPAIQPPPGKAVASLHTAPAATQLPAASSSRSPFSSTEHGLRGAESVPSAFPPESPYRRVCHTHRRYGRRRHTTLPALVSSRQRQHSRNQSSQVALSGFETLNPDPPHREMGRLKLPPIVAVAAADHARDSTVSSDTVRHGKRHYVQPNADGNRATALLKTRSERHYEAPPKPATQQYSTKSVPQRGTPRNEREQDFATSSRKLHLWPNPTLCGSVPDMDDATPLPLETAMLTSSAPDFCLTGGGEEEEGDQLFSSLPNLPVYHVATLLRPHTHHSYLRERSLAVPTLAECQFVAPGRTQSRISELRPLSLRGARASRSTSRQSARLVTGTDRQSSHTAHRGFSHAPFQAGSLSARGIQSPAVRSRHTVRRRPFTQAGRRTSANLDQVQTVNSLRWHLLTFGDDQGAGDDNASGGDEQDTEKGVFMGFQSARAARAQDCRPGGSAEKSLQRWQGLSRQPQIPVPELEENSSLWDDSHTETAEDDSHLDQLESAMTGAHDFGLEGKDFAEREPAAGSSEDLSTLGISHDPSPPQLMEHAGEEGEEAGTEQAAEDAPPPPESIHQAAAIESEDKLADCTPEEDTKKSPSMPQTNTDPPTAPSDEPQQDQAVHCKDAMTPLDRPSMQSHPPSTRQSSDGTACVQEANSLGSTKALLDTVKPAPTSVMSPNGRSNTEARTEQPAATRPRDTAALDNSTIKNDSDAQPRPSRVKQIEDGPRPGQEEKEPKPANAASAPTAIEASVTIVEEAPSDKTNTSTISASPRPTVEETREASSQSAQPGQASQCLVGTEQSNVLAKGTAAAQDQSDNADRPKEHREPSREQLKKQESSQKEIQKQEERDDRLQQLKAKKEKARQERDERSAQLAKQAEEEKNAKRQALEVARAEQERLRLEQERLAEEERQRQCAEAAQMAEEAKADDGALEESEALKEKELKKAAEVRRKVRQQKRDEEAKRKQAELERLRRERQREEEKRKADAADREQQRLLKEQALQRKQFMMDFQSASKGDLDDHPADDQPNSPTIMSSSTDIQDLADEHSADNTAVDRELELQPSDGAGTPDSKPATPHASDNAESASRGRIRAMLDRNAERAGLLSANQQHILQMDVANRSTQQMISRAFVFSYFNPSDDEES